MISLVLEKQEEYGYTVLQMSVQPCSVHMVLDVDPRIGIYKVVVRIKSFTSRQLREEFPHLRRRLPTLWTRNKFIVSVGTVQLEDILRYIETQRNV